MGFLGPWLGREEESCREGRVLGKLEEGRVTGEVTSNQTRRDSVTISASLLNGTRNVIIGH